MSGIFYWENPQNAREQKFCMGTTLEVAREHFGSKAETFDDLTDDEIDQAVLRMTEAL